MHDTYFFNAFLEIICHLFWDNFVQLPISNIYPQIKPHEAIFYKVLTT